MTLLRKTAPAKAMTGAILRVIRALTGLKGQYTKKELQKPFAIPRTTFSPDYSDPEVRKAMLSQGMNSIGSLFGSAPAPALTSAEQDNGRDVFDPEEFADNRAFASGEAEESYGEYSVDPTTEAPTQEQTGYTQPVQESSDPPQTQAPQSNYCCEVCGRDISDKVYEYSINRFGRPLCVSCQRGGRAQWRRCLKQQPRTE